MESSDQLSDMLARLQIKKYSVKEATAAFQGERIPDALGLPLLRLCTIRGIRYHDGFAHELRGTKPEFLRALNAREIMSNRIPSIDNLEEETPYCIWHPNTASEETYRQLVRKYPHMAYHVGRACAVAGDTDLFLELDILPEVHIAEEARECGNMDIFDRIMAKPARYNVMNDYDRIINTTDSKVGFLNGDTAVCASLDDKQRFTDADVPEIIDGEEFYGFLQDVGYREQMFNITEDESIHDVWLEGSGETTRADIEKSEAVLELLINPLPADLPTVDKDELICSAAYHGDIDRYCRLRRPRLVSGEAECIVRGIYHNTMFAVWWSKQELPEQCHSARIGAAICARFIMNNVLSKVGDEAKRFGLPYLIRYPTVAAPTTYRKLAEMAPKMLPQILRSCIVGDYKDLFDELVDKVTPDEAVIKEAEHSPNPHFLQVLEARTETVGKEEIESMDGWKMGTHRGLVRQTSTNLWKTVSRAGICGYTYWTWGGGLYNGVNCYAAELELLASVPDEWKIREGYWNMEVRVDYVDHPPQSKEVEEEYVEV